MKPPRLRLVAGGRVDPAPVFRPQRMIVPVSVFLQMHPEREAELRKMNGGELPESVLIKRGEWGPF